MHDASRNEGEASGNHDAAEINALHDPHVTGDIAAARKMDRLQTSINGEDGEQVDGAETVKHLQLMDEEG